MLCCMSAMLSPCTQEGVLEDDLHFWVECPTYSEIRKLYPSLFSIDATPISILTYKHFEQPWSSTSWEGVISNAWGSKQILLIDYTLTSYPH